MKISRILILAALLSIAHSFMAFSAEQSGGRSITLGDLTFSNHGTKDVKGQGELDLEADNYYFAPTFLRGTPKQKAQGGNRERVEYAARFQHPGSTPGCRYPEKGKSGGGNHFPPSGVV